MIEWYKMAFTKYADFKSRSTRNEFWWFVLCNILIIIGLNIMIGVFAGLEIGILAGLFGIIYAIYALAVFIPSLSVAVRRLHDTNRSGWFLLLSLIPFVGSIILLVFYAQESDPNSNKWGPRPGTSDGLEEALVDFDKDIV